MCIYIKVTPEDGSRPTHGSIFNIYQYGSVDSTIHLKPHLMFASFCAQGDPKHFQMTLLDRS
jgi:hypothetical protein